jgi:hypothetical protein
MRTVTLRSIWNTSLADCSLKSIGSSSLLFSSTKTVETIQKEWQVCIIRNYGCLAQDRNDWAVASEIKEVFTKAITHTEVHSFLGVLFFSGAKTSYGIKWWHFFICVSVCCALHIFN